MPLVCGSNCQALPSVEGRTPEGHEDGCCEARNCKAEKTTPKVQGLGSQGRADNAAPLDVGWTEPQCCEAKATSYDGVYAATITAHLLHHAMKFENTGAGITGDAHCAVLEMAVKRVRQQLRVIMIVSMVRARSQG